MDLIKLLAEDAYRLKDKPAVIFRDQPITFGRLRETSFRLADSLRTLGIKKGDKVGIYLPNCPEYICSYLAIWYLGATAVPLDYMLTTEELVSCLSHSEAKCLIARNKPNISFSQIKERCVVLNEIISCQEKTDLTLWFEDLVTKGRDNPERDYIEDKDLAIIFYTSGTTGKPKGVLINYPHLGAPPMSMDFFADLREDDIAVCALPFSHLGGLIYIQNCISYGITVVLLERFLPLEFLRSIQKYRATCFWIVPSMYYAILQLKEFEVFDLSSLRWMVTFGASSSPDALRRFHKYCPNAHLLNGWGLTETNAPTTVLPIGSGKIESVGKPAPWIEVKIFDDNDRELAPGNVGEVAVKSWVVSDGYYKDAELTAETMRNGYFFTGDLGKYDTEGNLYIVGRKKEMIKVGGQILFEPEVEAVLFRHPDIAEAAVIGVADKLRGEVPKAFIALKEGSKLGEDELRSFLRQHLAGFKIPHYFEFVSALPKNRTGKIDKEQLRK
ncbi:MAG: long-chain fatty acid--CoA ligase [Candidatus Omnitrophica bacterium]|nr:long-chain fatty acid--CoA ligase [Candidatus Omnitrophota bacterium]